MLTHWLKAKASKEPKAKEKAKAKLTYNVIHAGSLDTWQRGALKVIRRVMARLMSNVIHAGSSGT